MAKKTYYVEKKADGKIADFVKIEDGVAYAWNFKKKDWVESPSMIKIVFDMTEFDEIGEAEANEIIKNLKEEE